MGSSPLARGLHGGVEAVLGVERIIPARAGFTGTPAPPSRTSRDHPRSRGVYAARAARLAAAAGSSPLARGLREMRGGGVDTRRIIPARAGFTPTSPSSNPSRPDHPRSRGVYNRIFMHMIQVTGSSPLARGLRCPTSRVQRTCRDHPRSRGVYLSTPCLSGRSTGIIPARAGFTTLIS